MNSILVLLAPCALVASTLAQSTWYVDAAATPPGSGTTTAPYAKIQYAIDRPTTVSGDLVLVAPGVYVEQVDFHSKFLTLRASGGPLTTRIQAPSSGVVVTIFSGATIEGFSIAGHPSLSTIGILLDNGLARGCIVRDHHGTSGLGYGIDAGVGFGNAFGCTVVRNTIGAAGPTIGTFAVHSSIFAFNSSVDVLDIDPNYCLWGTGFAGQGIGNLIGDPRLWDLSQADFRLGFSSPCIDKGNPALPLDPDGSRADMGAVPFDAGYLPAISTYCTGKTHSQGCVAAISASGGLAASFSAPTAFVISASAVLENKSGLFFYSVDRDIKPFQGGFHCVKLPTKRTAVQSSGSSGVPCSGTYAFDFNAYLQAGTNAVHYPGQVLDGQYWFRDPSDPAGFGAGTSNAIEFPIGP